MPTSILFGEISGILGVVSGDWTENLPICQLINDFNYNDLECNFSHKLQPIYRRDSQFKAQCPISMLNGPLSRIALIVHSNLLLLD